MTSKDAESGRSIASDPHEVIVRLVDVLPRRVLDQWHVEVERCMERARTARHGELPQEEASRIADRNVGRLRRYLDEHRGSIHLSDPWVQERIAQVVNRNGRVEWCRVHPSYFEVRFRLDEGESVETVVDRWKRETARQINAHFGRQGAVWHHDLLQVKVK